MDKFAFIFHPNDMISLSEWVLDEPGILKKRQKLVERSLRWFPPFKKSSTTGMRSITGKEIIGEMVFWPMIPDQILNMESTFVVGKLIEAGKIAEDLGAKIVGLGAYAAWIGKKGATLAKSVNIAVTCGTCYTIVTVVQAVLEAARKVGIPPSEANVTVIGATGGIGGISAQLIARHVARLTLVARKMDKLEQMKDMIKQHPLNGGCDVQITDNIKESLKSANIVVVVTNTPTTIVDVNDINPGTVVCDISVPHNISQEDALKREDILVIDGGVVQPPGDPDFHVGFGLPKGLAYACMAETMILTYEGMFENYSIGGNITIEKVENIEQLGHKHGFNLARFKSFGKEVPDKKIENVKKAGCRK